MVSWGRAFKAALVLLAFSILWGIIGGIIMSAGFFGIPHAIGIIPVPPYIIVNWGVAVVFFIIIIIGYLISFLGMWASAFRIAVQLAIEEMRRTTPVATPPPPTTQVGAAPAPTCPKCGTPVMYVQQYQRWYCPTCREYQ